jgi:pimeloyl-ACP methyl ester carboxylesterase
VGFASAAGTSIQTIIDAREAPEVTASLSNTDAKYFDIIGFDPRGVNNTTPHARCFPDDESVATWFQQTRAQGFPRSNESFANAWGRSVSIGKSCSWRMSLDDGDDGDTMAVGKYVSTPNTVEDMVAIIEAFGEWREAEAKRLLAASATWLKKPCKKQQSQILERTQWRVGKEKLQYWGFSYGTLLGTTFATLHPDRIGRVAVDGQVDADDYYSGLSST